MIESWLQIWDIIIWNIAVSVVELQKETATQKTCWSVLLLLPKAGTDWKSSNEDITLGHSWMSLQGLNLSSTQDLGFHYDLALLQPVMNAAGVGS